MNNESELVRATITRVLHFIDAQRWDALRALFADEVETDYTSLFGGEPRREPSEALIGGWRRALETVVTQHLLGPIDVVVEGDRAHARCHVRAAHFAESAKSGNTWEVLGHYVFDLGRGREGWCITRMKLETFLQLGNRRLLEEAHPAD